MLSSSLSNLEWFLGRKLELTLIPVSWYVLQPVFYFWADPVVLGSTEKSAILLNAKVSYFWGGVYILMGKKRERKLRFIDLSKLHFGFKVPT